MRAPTTHPNYCHFVVWFTSGAECPITTTADVSLDAKVGRWGTIPGAEDTFDNFPAIAGWQPTNWADFIEKHKAELSY